MGAAKKPLEPVNVFVRSTNGSFDAFHTTRPRSGRQVEPLFKTISALDAKLFGACTHCDLWKVTRVISYEHNHVWLAT